MISIVKKEINIQNELLSKIKWACTFSNCIPKIKNGNLKMVEKTNIAYVEPHNEYLVSHVNMRKYPTNLFVMAKIMEMNSTEQNKIAMYLYNSI